MEQKITITAIDIPSYDISPKFREELHTAIDKRKAESKVGYQNKLLLL